ncbi:GTP-binding protein RAD-like [Limulus polyphemus]|uniref:GTP-binding protein RAD-like n=1 Tax=Limulus polyphemus TaxID=6850 RepID=A0ABM1BYL4_LIMPO|nr:GTP-binding protein RAD-like [Limulus polyphemus]
MAGKSTVSVKTSPRSLGKNRSNFIPTNTLNTCNEIQLQTKMGSSSLYTHGNALQSPGETSLHRSPSPVPYIRNCMHSAHRGSDHPESSLIICKQRSPDTFSRRSELSTMNDSQNPKMWIQTNKFNTRHSRSYSFRTMRRPSPQQLAEEEQFRPRGATMPSDSRSYLREKRRQRLRERSASPSWSPLDHVDDVDEDFYRLRNFSTTSKGGVINRGDQFRQRSRSSNSMASSYTYPSCISTDTSCLFGQEDRCTHLKVLVLGAVGVGKSSIVTQFMSSEYMNTYDVSQDDELEKTIFLLLDGEEYELTLFDYHTLATLTDPEEDSMGSADAYVVVYSMTDRGTFEIAMDILFVLRERGYTATRAVILVGNKSDLVRSRTVSTNEAKTIAISYECNFMETSAAINHKTDDLLVRIVSQVRLKIQQLKDLSRFSPPGRRRKSRSKSSLYGIGRRAKDLLNKLLGKGNYKSKSCDNLHII